MISDLRRRKLEKVFASFDPDGDGVITREDLVRIAGVWCATYGITPGSAGWRSVHEHAERWWDGLAPILGPDRATLTREDWLAAGQEPGFAAYVEQDAIPFSMAVFHVADADSDGRITLAEMTAAQSRGGMSEQETRDAFTRLDTDGDGRVSDAEYVAAARAFYLSDDPDAAGNLIAGRL